MKKTILGTGFLAALVAVLALGFLAANQPADARPPGTPITDCPSIDCPENLTGWVKVDTCTTMYTPECVEICDVWRNSSTGELCKETTFCRWH